MIQIIQGDCLDVLPTLDVKWEPETLAYCAGVIDSDGTIGIKKNTYAMRIIGDCQQPTYSERICVKQVQPEAVDLLWLIFRGRRAGERPSCRKGKNMEVWQVSDKRAAITINALLPYLRIKRKQALNCMDLRRIKEISKKARVSFGRGHVGGCRRPEEISIAMENLYLRAKNLNRVGKEE